MLKTSSMVYKTLVAGVIILFCGISVQPCIAIVQNNERLESTSYPNDSKLLAVMGMDIGDYIYNDRIEYEEKRWRPEGKWNVNVRINFSCPADMKIEVKYSYFAELDDWPLSWITFCDVKDTVTIINGSNPPNINIDYTKRVGVYYNFYILRLTIEANLTAYEYIGGEWIKSYNDDIYIKITDDVGFYKSRSSERTHFLMRFFERFPNMEVFLRIMNLLR